MSVQPAGSDFFSDCLLPFEEPYHLISLNTVDGVLHPDFRSACVALSLLNSDNEWHHTIEEAAAFETGSQLRWLFICILLNCHPADFFKLCDDHHLHLSDDCTHLLTTKYGIKSPSNEQIKCLV